MDTEGPCDDPGLPELNATWERVDACMDKLFAREFRERLPDPHGGVLRVGWFFLTWTGFRTNPRNRDFGYHRVRDHWTARGGAATAAYSDDEGGHHHQPGAGGPAEASGRDWS